MKEVAEKEDDKLYHQSHPPLVVRRGLKRALEENDDLWDLPALIADDDNDD